MGKISDGTYTNNYINYTHEDQSPMKLKHNEQVNNANKIYITHSRDARKMRL